MKKNTVKDEKEHSQERKRTQLRMKNNTVKNEKEHSQEWKRTQ